MFDIETSSVKFVAMSSTDIISQMENGENQIELISVELRNHNEDSQPNRMRDEWQGLFETLSQPGDNAIDIAELENHIKDASSQEVTILFFIKFCV